MLSVFRCDAYTMVLYFTLVNKKNFKTFYTLERHFKKRVNKQENKKSNAKLLIESLVLFSARDVVQCAELLW